MLGSCNSLLECEEMLQQEIKDLKFLGELNLTEYDHNKLCNFIGEASGNIREKTDYFIKNAPVSFVFYLLCMGIFEYRGDYWAPLRRHMGGLDHVWKNRWGKVFYDFLSDYKLPKIDIDEKNLYSTNILYHTGVPIRLTHEFIEKISLPHVFSKLSPEKIKNEVVRKRDHDFKREKIKIEIEALESEKQKWEEELDRLKEVKAGGQNRGEKETSHQENKFPQEVGVNRYQLESYMEEIKNELDRIKKEKRNLQESLEQYQDIAFSNGKSIGENNLHEFISGEGMQSLVDDEEKLAEHTSNLEELKEAQDKCKEEIKELLRYFGQVGNREDDISFIFKEIPWILLLEKIKEYAHAKSNLDVLKIELEENKHFRINPGFNFWGGALLTVTGLGLNWWYVLPDIYWSVPMLGAILIVISFRRLSRRINIRRKKKKRNVALSEIILDEKNRINEMEKNLLELMLEFPRPTLMLNITEEQLPYVERLVKLTQEYQYLKNKKEVKEKSRERYRKKVEEVAAALPQPPSDVLQTSSYLKQEIEYEKDRKEHMEAARDRMQEIEKEINKIIEKEEKLDREYARCKQKAAAYNDSQGFKQTGDSESNCNKLISPELQDYLDEVRKRCQLEPGDVEDVVVLEKKIKSMISIRDKRIREKQKEMREYPPVYTGVDETVKRFILYGEGWAEQWLVGTVELISALLDKEEVPHEITDIELPQRLVDSIIKWWER